MLSTKEIVLVIHVTLAKPDVMQMLDGMNIITQLKVQNHHNNIDSISSGLYYMDSISNAPKMIRPGRT